MSNTIDNSGAKNIFGKKVPTKIAKSALFGATVGAATGTIEIGKLLKDTGSQFRFKDFNILDKDSFIRSDSAKLLGKNIGRTALIAGGIGAVIGGISLLINKIKSNKANNAEKAQ